MNNKLCRCDEDNECIFCAEIAKNECDEVIDEFFDNIEKVDYKKSDSYKNLI